MIQQYQRPKAGKILNFILHNQTARVFLFEFIGSTFLIFMCTSIAVLPPYEDHPHDQNIYRLVYVALVVYSIICFIGPITGAHINPAVTLMAYLQRKKRNGQISVIIAYLTAELLGCLLGAILSRNIYGNGGAIFVTTPDVIEMGRLCIEQGSATFIFLFFILILTTEETTFVYDQAWVHLMIAIVYYICLTLSSRLHLLNPAVVFGIQLEAMIEGGVGSDGLPACLFIIVSEFVGAGLADLVFRKIYVKTYAKWKNNLS